MSASDALLDLRNVTLRRGGRLLFEKFDLALRPGEAALVTGPNGAGKSSLIRLAAGLLQPTGGSIDRGGPIALADDALALDQRQTLAAALGFWAALDNGNAARGMAVMGLDPLAAVPVFMLSSGQRKRATLARVIAGGAPLWLLDEPGNALDGDGQALLAAAMADHLTTGGAILAASHQPLGLEAAVSVELGL